MSTIKVTVNEVCIQIYELFYYDPNKTLLPEDEARLTDISHAYGILLYHYRKQHQNFETEITECVSVDVSDHIINELYIIYVVAMSGQWNS